MREYELVYIIQPDASPEKEKELQTQIGEMLSRAGAVTLLWDDWGKRKLAYEIRKLQKGHYVLVNFLGGGGSIPEIERMLRIDPDILRFLTVKVNERVRDVDARIEEARKEEAERARRREERERAEAERAEAERVEQERMEQERLEQERLEQERLAAEAAAATEVATEPEADGNGETSLEAGESPEVDTSNDDE